MKNFAKLFGIIALGALIGFSFAGCDQGNNGGNGETKTLSAGTYNGTPTGAKTSTNTENQTLNSVQNAGVLENMTASFEINTDGTMGPMFGSGNSAFLAAVVQQNGPLYRFVLGNDNTLTLETKLWAGSGNDYGNWENWNTRNANAIGANVVKSLSGSFNPSTGKVTLTFTYTQGQDSSSRTYEFTKQ